MFISVMEKLPPTSYVRMVDVWLIFGQLIPFVEVSLLTIREMYNDENQHINHHGTALEVEHHASNLTLSVHLNRISGQKDIYFTFKIIHVKGC